MKDEEGVIARITGNIHDLKSGYLSRIKKIGERRVRGNAVVTQEFARTLCEISNEIGRQLGVLIDRQGRIRDIMVGDARRIFIPELDRRVSRLRGVRLVHTHLTDEPLTEEDLADLTLLRLDYISAVVVGQDALPRLYYNAHLLPGLSPPYRVEPAVRPGQLAENFSETLLEIETLFDRDPSKLKESVGPGAFLVGIYTPRMRAKRDPSDSIAELRELSLTSGIRVVDTIIQKRPRIDPVTLIGSGKVKEISIRAIQENVEMLIFDMELSPAQATRISSLTDLKIIDRTQLILDIFARNAKSKDGKLQVELAQLRYLRGRLSETDDNMSRLTGGIGGRGPGETKLEIGNRRVAEKIHRLEKELASLKKRRELNRERRSQTGIPVCSIVGYTNAGKSTLLNRLTNSDVTAEDRLFATLDPTTRRVRFPKEREMILSDTVGFIHDLPPELKRAFEATLEELGDSDLLIHLIDASHREWDIKIKAVENILHSLNLGNIPVIRVYNKMDILTEEQMKIIEEKEDSVLVSAIEGKNMDKLLTRIEQKLFLSPTQNKYEP